MMKIFPAFRSLFYRYVAFYISLLVLPLVSMSVLVTGRYFHAYLDETNAQWASRLTQIRSSVETNFSQIANIAFQLSNNEYVQRAQHDINPVVGRKIMSELRKFNATNSFIHEIVVIFPPHHIWYASSTSYTARTFLSHFYQYDPIEFVSWLEGLRVPSILPEQSIQLGSGDSRTILANAFPLPVGGIGEPFGYVVFLIDSADAAELLTTKVGLVTDNLVVVDAAGTPILSFGPRYAAAGGEIRTIRVASDDNGWDYRSYIPSDMIEGRFREIRKTFFFALGAITFFGGALIFVFMRYSWGAINRVSTQIKGFTRASEVPVGNELDVIRESFRSIMEEITFLSERATIDHEVVKDYVVFNLLQGRFSDPTEVNLHAAESALRLDAREYAAVAVQVDKDLGFDTLEQMLRTYEKIDTPEFQLYGRMSVQKSRLVFVTGARTRNHASILRYFQTLSTELSARYSAGITVGIGLFRESLLELPASYIEASSALDYRFVIGGGDVIEFSRIRPSKSVEYRQPFDAVHELTAALSELDRAEFDRTMDAIANDIVARRPPLVQVKMHVAEVFRAVAQELQNGGTVIEPTQELQDVFLIARFESVDTLLSY
ncbi:MAG: hypothetical protein EA426_09510, partial [Spirochaetaceae bacterium]